MNKKNDLIYFLNSMKHILPFKDENDFRKKIIENKEFKIKVQKLVYLSKFFGWNNPYIFTLAPRGPYSIELKQTYSTPTLFDNIPNKIKGFDIHSFLDFVKDKNLLFIEATATILYQFNDEISENECVKLIHSMKCYIPTDIIRDAYIHIKQFNLFDKNITATANEITEIENHVNIKIKDLTEDFLKFEPSTNRIIVTGSIDYMRISLRESNLNLKDTYNLLIFIERYLFIISQLLNKIHTDSEFTYMDLDYLEELFDQFQNFVSEEHHIIKKIDDDDFDENLFY